MSVTRYDISSPWYIVLNTSSWLPLLSAWQYCSMYSWALQLPSVKDSLSTNVWKWVHWTAIYHTFSNSLINPFPPRLDQISPLCYFTLSNVRQFYLLSNTWERVKIFGYMPVKHFWTSISFFHALRLIIMYVNYKGLPHPTVQGYFQLARLNPQSAKILTFLLHQASELHRRCYQSQNPRKQLTDFELHKVCPHN